MNKITVAIMCYGLYGYEYRTPEEVKDLIDYFYSCAQYIKTLHKRNRLSGIVLCGGFTNPQYPDVSEAGTSAQYLLNLLKIYEVPVEEINACLEEQSYNTAQNIVFTGRMLKGTLLPYTPKELIKATTNYDREKMLQNEARWNALDTHNVVFICDRYRWLKVQLMLRWVKYDFPSHTHLSVKSFPRPDIHPNSCWSKQLVAALLYWWNPTRFFDDLKFKPL